MELLPEDINVTDRQSFIQFLEAFHHDLLTNEADWENVSLDRFLEAMVAYARDIQGYYNNTSPNINADKPSWKVFADIMKGARVNE